MQADSKHYDCTISYGNGKTFRGHIAILTGACPYFEKALLGDFREGTERHLDMSEDDEEAVEAMLKFIYGCSAEEYVLAPGDLKLREVAKKLTIGHLEQIKQASKESINALASELEWFIIDIIDKAVETSKRKLIMTIVGLFQASDVLCPEMMRLKLQHRMADQVRTSRFQRKGATDR